MFCYNKIQKSILNVLVLCEIIVKYLMYNTINVGMILQYRHLQNSVKHFVTPDLLFSDVQNLNQVLMSVVQGAVESPDPTSQKLCFSILRKMIDIWGKSEFRHKCFKEH